MSLGLTLAVDGSTYAGSVALIRERDVLAQRQLEAVPHPGKAGKAENFMPMVAECLRDGQVRPSDLARVVCGEDRAASPACELPHRSQKELLLARPSRSIRFRRFC